MAVGKWKEIWNSKSLAEIEDKEQEFHAFCQLKKANGFDVAVKDENSYFSAFYREWQSFYENAMKLTNHSIDSVYEVGCGSGVNLFMFQNRGIKRVGGIDYSESLLKSAEKITGSADMTVGEATDIETASQYDLVMADSVFQYFSSLSYAEAVLRKMIEKSRRLVYLGEVHDKQYEEELIQYRKAAIKDYEARYRDLSKQFYERAWFEKLAAEYGRRLMFAPVRNPEYLNAKYVFNVYIYIYITELSHIIFAASVWLI